MHNRSKATSAFDSRRRQLRTLDPIISLQVPAGGIPDRTWIPQLDGTRSSVAALCFLPNIIEASDSESSDDDDDDGDLSFRCRNTLLHEKLHDDDLTARARESAASLSLTGMILASSHTNGDAFLWDLGRRRIVAEFCENRGKGMALRRLHKSSQLLYQTRDDNGTVSIHDLNKLDYAIVAKFETHSRTFCQAAPCEGNGSLVVMPSDHECYATVRDVRISSQSPPVATFHAAAIYGHTNDEHKHGMLTSVAMSDASATCPRPVVSCGMESGSIFFHDLAMSNKSCVNQVSCNHASITSCSLTLGKEPILAIDLAKSPATSPSGKSSLVAVAGMAGDAAELSELDKQERGTVAVVKVKLKSDVEEESIMSSSVRARVSTCDIGEPDEPNKGGKPGVNICRFRPDGRIFAVGGWDRRLRIFERQSDAAPLAILKSHTDSLTAMDWAPNADVSGLLATGAGDGRIAIWRCFSTNES